VNGFNSFGMDAGEVIQCEEKSSGKRVRNLCHRKQIQIPELLRTLNLIHMAEEEVLFGRCVDRLVIGTLIKLFELRKLHSAYWQCNCG
jgi:hypothetical protein